MTSAPQAAAPSPVAPHPQEGRRISVIGAWGPRIVLIAVGAVTLISIAFVLFGASGDAIGRIVFTDLALIAFGLLVWLDAIIGRYRPDWFEVTSMAADAYLLLIWVGIIWLGEPDGVDVFLGFYVFVVVRLALLHLDLVRWLVSRWTNQINRIIGGVAIASISAFFIMLTLPCLEIFNHFWDIDFYGRIVAALAILGSMSTIMIPLTALLYNRKPKDLPAARPAGYGPGGYPAASAPAGYGAQAPGQVAPFGAPASQQQVQPPQFPGDSASAAATLPSVAPTASVLPGAASAGPVSAGSPSTVASASAPASGSQQRTWPTLADGTPLPATTAGAPDFSALRPDQQLAWPTYVDGSPVPAGPDGSPVDAD